MSIQDRILDFPKLNPDYILENKGEFLAAVDVDSSILPKYQRNLVNSYGQEILSNLSDRLQAFVNNKYENTNTNKPQNKQYEVKDIEGTEKYKRIFYYLQFDQKKLIPKKIKDNEQNIKNALNSNISLLNFNPTQKDKNTISTKSVIGAVFETDSFTKRFKDWYLCSFEEVSKESPIKTALDKILKSLSKKGTWTINDTSEQILKNSKDNVELVPLSVTRIKQIKEKENILYTPFTDDALLLPELEQNIFSFYKSFNISNTKPEILFNNESFQSGISIFYKTYNDSISNNKSYLIGLPKSFIDQFPDLSLSIDYKEILPSDYIAFKNIQDINTSIEILKNTIGKKKESLSNISLKIKNDNIDYYISNIEQLIGEITNKAQKEKIDLNKKITLYFGKTNCTQKPLVDNPDINSANDAEYKKCLNEFVDGQTNFVLYSITLGEEYELPSVTKILDENLGAYLLLNCKKIVNASDLYVAKNFFSKLIYSKIQFEKEESLNLNTFITTAETSFQNSFINDVSNIVKYSKIKQNIEKENYKNKTVSQNIKDALTDINSIKKLYETILYRYDLKDVADELLKCILSENPSLNDAIIGAELFVDNLVKFLNVKDPNILKLANCFNLKIPTSLGVIKLDDLPPAGDFSINLEELKNSLSSFLSSSIKIATDIDFVVPTIIKCYNEFGNEQVKTLINTYVESEEARKALKQQYDQLVIEAKLYKSAPGVKDSLKKQVSEKKTFLKKAIRNAWILLQKQAEQEAERIVTEASIALIKSLLKDLNDCKPQNSKNTKNNQAGSPGDLRLNNTSNLLDKKINNLLALLSGTLNPEKLCSLFYGSADDETYESVLVLIKQQISDLYISPQVIKIDKTIFFSEPLSSINAVRKFFISLATANPDLTINKCNKHFEDISNLPFDINDEEKCIDFSQEYVKKKRQELIDRGFTEEQANEIIDNQKKLQTEKYKNLQKTLEVGIYNELSSKSENTILPVADMVKQKIEKQLEGLTTSNGEFIDAYKNQILQLAVTSFNSFSLDLKTYEDIFGKNGDILKIGLNTIFYKKTESLNPYKEIKPTYQYISNEIYNISLKSQEYESLKSASSISPFLSLQKKLKFLWSNFNNSFSNFDDLEDDLWIKICLEESVKYYSKAILETYKQDFEIIKQEKFDKDKILTEIKELIYFEEE